jgi:hypothetical protein
MATDFMQIDINFAIQLFQAAELEARETERFILLAIGAIYAYLTTKEVPDKFKRVAWFSPPAIAIFAAVRALGLMLRQVQMLEYLRSLESCGLADSRGLACWLSHQPPVLALPMGIFYLLLIGITLAIAIVMVRRKGVQPESKREVEVKT